MTDITLRTTSDGTAYSHAVVIGSGETVDQAMIALADEAKEWAERIARQATAAQHAAVSGPGPVEAVAGGDRWFEVADVRLVHAAGGTDDRWVAYGTLRSARAKPGGGGYWDAGSLD